MPTVYQTQRKKKKILAEAADIKNGINKLCLAAQKLSVDPTNQTLQKELAEYHKSLVNSINSIRKDGNLIPNASQNNTELDLSSGKSGEAQLAQAAIEEATAALQLAKEAELLLAKTTDSAKKQKIQSSINELKNAAAKVSEMANIVQLNPYDSVAQQKLTAAQKELSDCIQKVVNLVEDKDSDVADAMEEMRIDSDPKKTFGVGTEQQVLLAAQTVLDDILKSFSTENISLDPQKVITNAKELSLKASELAKQLRQLAENTSDPVLKEKYLNSSKIIRDSSIQVKILSAVRAAGAQDNKSNSVAMSIKLMQTNIQEVMKEVATESIKNKFRATVKTTMAINKVVNAWKKKIIK